MAHYSVQEFITTVAQDGEATAPFQLENPYLLEVNLNGRVWARRGAMIGYAGQVEATQGDRTSLMKMDGRGRVYLADRGKKIQILHLQDETIVVNRENLLAFQDSLHWDVTLMYRRSTILPRGLYNVRLDGAGMAALTTHHDPLALRVRPGQPVHTDPNATVAWAGSLDPEVLSGSSFEALFLRGSGESLQLRFEGEGWVVLQPFEETYQDNINFFKPG
jgi:uncharacterized protein (AIM24 family)